MKIKVIDVQFHRNGSGPISPFDVVVFQQLEGRQPASNMIAIVFPAKGHISILNKDLLDDNIHNYPNRFDGGYYEETLRKIVNEIERDGKSEQIGKWIKVV